MSRKVFINTEYITLGKLLKFENILESGGFAKDFLLTTKVTVNGVLEQRRGRKLFPGDIIDIENIGSLKIDKNEAKTT